MDYLGLISKSEEGEKLRILADLKDDEEEILDDLSSNKWISTQPIMSEYEAAMSLSKKYNMNVTEAKSQLDTFPKEYKISDKTIPDIVKDLRKHRRTLKGEDKISFTKGIDNLIMAYSDHLSDCIKSIYWLAPYEVPLRQMRYTETDLKKIHTIKDVKTRRMVIESLCKFWEADLTRGHNYDSDYSSLSKTMTNSKREFRKIVTTIPHQVIKSRISDQLDDFVLKSVCDNQGISARQIYDRLPAKLHRRASPQIICKVADKMRISNIDGEYYKLPMEIKKDLHAYTAAFIDSDGYITMDRNFNPRIGIIATGNRGKAFVTELHKELGQCRPYFRMKGDNADILTELIRIKKHHKKQPWAKPRMAELFKLMKWANHADHVNYDFSKDDIDVENIAKYKGNNKMSVMDELETISKSPKMTVMQMRQKIEERMETPTLRVEERKPNEIQGTIELDVDMEGDCCSQLKEELMSEWVSTLDIVDFTLESDNKLDGWSYQEWVDAYADSLSSMSCEELVEDLENSKHMSRLKPIIDAYHSCNFGADSSAKYAMYS